MISFAFVKEINYSNQELIECHKIVNWKEIHEKNFKLFTEEKNILHSKW
jgi:hypothetical protein